MDEINADTPYPIKTVFCDMLRHGTSKRECRCQQVRRRSLHMPNEVPFLVLQPANVVHPHASSSARTTCPTPSANYPEVTGMEILSTSLCS